MNVFKFFVLYLLHEPRTNIYFPLQLRTWLQSPSKKSLSILKCEQNDGMKFESLKFNPINESTI